MVLKDALKEHFAVFGVVVNDEATLNKCLDLCDLYNLNEEALVETWMAFSVSQCRGDNPTVEYLLRMERNELKKDTGSAGNSKADAKLSKLAVYNSHSMKQYNDDEDILELYGAKTPTTPRVKRLRSPEGEQDNSEVKVRAVDSPFTPSSFSPKVTTPSRHASTPSANRGKILLKFGSDPESWKTDENSIRKVKVKRSEDQPHVPSKALYMYEKLLSKAEALDIVGEELGSAMCKTVNNIDKVEIEPVGVYSRSQYQIQSYGRICCDSEGKLNTASIMLEGTKHLSSGVRVKLDLGKLDQYSVFPGQIVSVKGVNPTGHTLVVKNLFFESPAPPSASPKLAGSDLRIVVAAGPFTQSDNLAYEPLLELIDYVSENQPHVLILVGPFVEFSHTEIQKCEMALTFDDFFEQCVGNIMRKLKDTCTQVILVSSNRDVHHEPIFPTPEFRLKHTYPNLHLMPDPCMIDIEGVIIGSTSVDSLMHLGREEISFNSTRFDRLTRLATHLLAQKCFYPLVPPSEEVNVDTDLWEKYAFMHQQPHILILPSSLRYFCNKIYDCVAMNPERLVKGSFARLRVTVPPKDTDSWKPSENVAVHILKI
ncbi:DNA polymerase alpha subunit B [Neodiprion pinetum]|uniref:DNA polymerase alpha subunit B n=1 Tax=Neodiprion pinetum TaxID=441929 RepID=UPI001EDF9809|nr:DNA polymerase alpha subunit B [Neodiprion pinetum]